MSLLLDAAFPPTDVNQWIATLRMAGADGCMAYIWDEQIVPDKWMDPAYTNAILNVGFGILPVYVWGPDYPAVGHARQIMANHGWSSGPVMGDIEAGSNPSIPYFQDWCRDLDSNGFTSVTYGTGSTLDVFRRYSQKGYLASYIQRTLKPIPSLVGASIDGWQYANSFMLNGVEVDASVTNIQLIGGTNVPKGEFGGAGGSSVVTLSTLAGRLDFIYVGTDGKVYHRWQTTKINDLATSVESWGGGPFVPAMITTCYTDGGATFAILAVKLDGSVWFKEVAVNDGHTINDWAPMGGNAFVGLPSGGAKGVTGDKGPVGDKGATGDKGPIGDAGVVKPHSHTVGTTSTN